MVAPTQKPEWRKVLKQILPSEHGSWAFVLEPVVIGWIAFPDLAARVLLIAGFLAFLAYRPARFAITDLQKRKRYPRTIPSAVAAAALALCVLLCGWLGRSVLVADSPYLAICALLGAAFLWLEATAPPRSLPRELVGACLMLPLLAASLRGFPFERLAAPLVGYLFLRVAATVLSVRSVFKRTSDWRACQIGGAVAAVALLPVAYGIHHIAGHPSIPNYTPVVVRSLWLCATPGVKREAKSVGMWESLVSVLCVLLWGFHLIG